jgi:putative ABC transport system ATP-binding protein
MESAIEVRDLRFSYRPSQDILAIPALNIGQGETVFVHGPSGSGKTTLLGLLAGVLKATRGEVRIQGEDLTAMSGSERDAFRATHIGYIFQMFNLIPYLDVLENIMLPCRISALRKQRLGELSLKEAALSMAESLGLRGVEREKVVNLSVGQQQRVAAGRALIGSPEIVIADEPTSSLDEDHREKFLELLFKNASKAGSTVVFVSHDRRLAPLFQRAVALSEINQITNS